LGGSGSAHCAFFAAAGRQSVTLVRIRLTAVAVKTGEGKDAFCHFVNIYRHMLTRGCGWDDRWCAVICVIWVKKEIDIGEKEEKTRKGVDKMLT